jgi:ParB family transcriptional regulator, chromosome partitioning protein
MRAQTPSSAMVLRKYKSKQIPKSENPDPHRIFKLGKLANPLLLSDIRLDRIIPNRYNSRLKYNTKKIRNLANSLEREGQLAIVRVKPVAGKKGNFELVFGHRRYLAAKMLGWKYIKAEIVDSSEEQMALHSLVENFEREELSDYEKAKSLERLVKQFGKTYEQVGTALNITRQTVCNYLAMLRLFESDEINSDGELISCLQTITEHHARVLSQITNQKAKLELIKLTVKEHLSVRDLKNVIYRLRSWYPATHDKPRLGVDSFYTDQSNSTIDEKKTIAKIIVDSYEITRTNDFESFQRMHMFGNGYSLFSGFASTELEEDEEAVIQERKWFYEIAPNLVWKINNLKVNIFGNVAVATLIVSYTSPYGGESTKITTRGTVVLIKTLDSWKIFHEHYSAMNARSKHDTLSAKPHIMIN